MTSLLLFLLLLLLLYFLGGYVIWRFDESTAPNADSCTQHNDMIGCIVLVWSVLAMVAAVAICVLR